MMRRTIVTLFAAIVITCAMSTDAALSKPADLMQSGHYAEAYAAYTNVVFAVDSVNVTDGNRAQAVLDAARCLVKLKRAGEVEPFLERAHKERDEFPVHVACSQALGELPHAGNMVKGVYTRIGEYGPYSSRERDRTLRLKWLVGVMPRLKEQTKLRQRWFWNEVVSALEMNGRTRGAAWKLQELTDLEMVPEVVKSHRHWGGCDFETGPAPVDQDGEVVFHRLPKSWAEALSDGERWMFANTERATVDDFGRRNSARSLGNFAENQFGTAHLRGCENAVKLADELGTLEDDETITRVANGIKRIKLPVEYNYLRMWHELKEYGRTAREYERRYQFAKAAEAYVKADDRANADRITAPSVALSGSVPSVSYARRGKFEVTSRNATELEFSLQLMDTAKRLDELVSAVKSRGRITDYRELELGWNQFFNGREMKEIEKYLVGEKKSWSVKVEPLEGHRDQLTQVSVPFDLPGGDYFLEARAKGGSTIHSVLRVDSLGVVKGGYNIKSGGDVYVVDAETGLPVTNANVKVFSWGAKYGAKDRKFKLSEKSVLTGADGCAVIPKLEKDENDWWRGFIQITTADGKAAVLPAEGYWYFPVHIGENSKRAVIITDRGAYRPGDTLKYRIWMRDGAYGKGQSLKGTSVEFSIHSSADWKKVYEKMLVLDEYGSAAGEFAIPGDAKLGEYFMVISGIEMPSSSFRIEEYRKPEFEVVVDTPKDAPMLGDKVSVTLKAKYYWGESVKRGLADITVRRSPRRCDWHPFFDWDWLYGAGANWYFYDTDWYSGPGCLLIARAYDSWDWSYRGAPPSETVVTMKGVPLDENGEARITWDTALVRKLYGDEDQEYSISVSVADKSRRTIDAASSVIVRAEPFRVFAWVDRPRYRIGDKITAHYHLDGLDEKNVKEVKCRLYTVDGDIVGEVEKTFSASKRGQYRLSVEVTDLKGRKMEGSRVFIVTGEGDDGRNFRYSTLELVPDKAVYAPGDKVKLTVNADYPDSTVFVKVRDEKPYPVRLKGKTGIIEIAVVESDKPNFFVEAWTVSAGAFTKEKREIMVPPVDKIGKAVVEIDGARDVFKPGETVSATVRVFDEKGKPVDASGVMSVYDRAIDSIAPGIDVESLKRSFWGGRRSYYSCFAASLGSCFSYLNFAGFGTPHDVIGLFGQMIVGNRCLGTVSSPVVMRSMLASRRERKSKVSVEPQPASVEFADCALESAEAECLDPGPLDGTGLRKDFADTAYWNAALENSGTQGVYRVKFKMPEDITSWNVKVWTVGIDGRVAGAKTEIVTKKDLMLRMTMPRFFTERDEVVLSANVHNYGGKKIDALVSISLEGVKTEGDTREKRVSLNPGGEARVDWRVKVLSSGRLKARMKIAGGGLADGVEKEFDVVSHSIEKTESYFRRLKAGADIPGGVYEGEEGWRYYRSLGFPLPDAAVMKNRRAVVEVTDTLAGAIDKSLDYLKYYEYECNEQTMNRFVPAAVARDILKERGFASRLHDVDELIEKGLRKLAERQNSDGGWGWFWGAYERSYEHMTATIVRGLAEAERAGVKVPDTMLKRGCAWLKNRQKESLDYIMKHKTRPWATDVLTAYTLLLAGEAADDTMKEVLHRSFEARLDLPVYAQAMLGLAFDLTGESEKRDTVARNLMQYLKSDDENRAAYLELGNSGYWWCWYGSDLEAQAMALKLFLKAEPQGEAARGIALYLFNNRKARTHWTNTRDTGLAVEALAEYCRKVEKRGDVYVSAYLTYDTYEEPIKAAGLELKVNRVVSRVVEEIADSTGRGAAGQSLAQRRTKERLEPLKDLSMVKAGETLEIRLDIDSKNDYEYVLIEDMKGAGFEPVDTKSGWKSLGGGWGYVEFREKKTAVFLREVPRGASSLVYRVRVETPGEIHVLPAKVEAMYAPRLRGNSDELRLKVKEANYH